MGLGSLEFRAVRVKGRPKRKAFGLNLVGLGAGAELSHDL